MTWTSIEQRLRRPVDGASLAAFRLLFGLVMFAAIARFAAQGWIEELYLQPRFHFTYAGLWFIRPLPAPYLHLCFGGIAVAALLIAVGLFYRASVALFFVGFTYVELLDKATYLNHYYLISLLGLLLLFLPADRLWSVDAWRKGRRGEEVPAWAPMVLRAQLAVVYLFAGIAKLRGDWLFQAQPLRTWLLTVTEWPVLGPLFAQAWFAYAMSWAGALFDLTIVGWLLFRRTRPLAYAAVVVFHGLTGALFHIGMFPIVMIALTTIFFEPSWPRRLLRGLAPPVFTAEGAPSTGRSRLATAAICLWFSVQVLVPLRHLLYPGSTLWTETGYRFSWNVMLMEKTGVVDFHVRAPASGRRWTIHPREVLTPLQVKMMSTQPDMILQFARHLATRFDEPVEVRAEAWVSLNGRPGRLLIDPDRDLLRVEDGLGRRNWVLGER